METEAPRFRNSLSQTLPYVSSSHWSLVSFVTPFDKLASISQYFPEFCENWYKGKEFLGTSDCVKGRYWFCHTLTWIHHRCIWAPNPESPSHLPPYIISLDHPYAAAPSILYPVLNIGWRFISYMIVYMFQCHFPKSSHPLPLFRVQKSNLVAIPRPHKPLTIQTNHWPKLWISVCCTFGYFSFQVK